MRTVIRILLEKSGSRSVKLIVGEYEYGTFEHRPNARAHAEMLYDVLHDLQQDGIISKDVVISSDTTQGRKKPNDTISGSTQEAVRTTRTE